MSAHRKWPTPAEQMLVGLAYGRRRGVTFDHAWSQSWLSIRWGNHDDRVPWRAALIATRPEFKAAWHGRETPISRALAATARGTADQARSAAIPLVALARVA